MSNKKSGSFLRNMVKNKFKKKGKKVLKALIKKIMFPWGLIFICFIFVVIFAISVAKTGFMGDQTFSDNLNEYQNKELAGFLTKKVKDANGSMDDMYGMAKKVALTDGNVEGFISLVEMEQNQDIDKMVSQSGRAGLLGSEDIISEYAELLKPDFSYKDDSIVTTVTVNTKDSTGQNVTSSPIVTKEKVKLLTSADALKGKVDITYKVQSQTKTDVKTRTYEKPKANQPPAAANNPNSKPEMETVTETTTTTTKVDTPVIDKVTESGKSMERLKSIIKQQFPNEDTEDKLKMAAHFVIAGASNDYDTKQQNGDWMNKDPNDDSIVNDILDAGADNGFSGEIPLFRQTDARWASQPYGQGNIGTSGCGPTSFAMIISGLSGKLGSWDKNGDGMLDPGEAATYAIASGYNSSTGEGTSWGLFDNSSTSQFGINSSNEIEPSNYSYVYDQLKEGNPVVASMHAGHFTKGGHFIVLTGVDTDGQVLINDPNPKTGINKFPIEGIASEANLFWVFNNPNIKYDSFICTAYGGVHDGMEGGGTTADGTNLDGKDFTARVIAVDPSVIKLGSRVYIQFPDNKRYQNKNGQRYDLNGWYTARDTGGAIKGNHIDLFMGFGGADDTARCDDFGTVNIKVRR
ncbi:MULTISPECIES: 3D domain-containing protein [Clostridium]|uniref:3D domain-containing protein n=1 Tax=Clostridium pasteurianum TaxID=1501 RepID=UPI000824E607|nr:MULTISPECIES: 3D domain-containing protein [Clostridium]PJI06585.1 murein hydrolase [Clostridium sp. CT7]